MRYPATVLYFTRTDEQCPEIIRDWATGQSLALSYVHNKDDLRWAVLRNIPQMIIVDVDDHDSAAEACATLRADSFAAVIPILCYSMRGAMQDLTEWFRIGADEVITSSLEHGEQTSRLDSLLWRTRRNVSVHPTTMLPGTVEIEKEIRVRIERGENFAVCYADLDHFKEYNDRYNYQSGDRIIFMVSRILRDAVNGICERNGFTGHIGGDDFIFIVPTEIMAEVCKEVVSVFDTLIPLQYSDQDRSAGYFLGEDRRGQLHKVPIMTISIGVVTSSDRQFEHPAQVGALATEMKSYAKSLPGSVYVVDRRRESTPATPKMRSDSSQ